MNVKDVVLEDLEGDRLDLIFARQTELMSKYHEIERKNGLGIGLIPGTGFHIDNRFCQYICKDYAWRVMEEIAEAMAAEESQIHRWEEAADGLHFLVELLILNDIDSNYVTGYFGLGRFATDRLRGMTEVAYLSQTPGDPILALVRHLGMAMNCLKNKPWKITHMETDRHMFYINLMEAFRAWFMFATKSLDMVSSDIFDIYYKKSEVNKFRQRSQY
jgi:hypothetical protein